MPASSFSFVCENSDATSCPAGLPHMSCSGSHFACGGLRWSILGPQDVQSYSACLSALCCNHKDVILEDHTSTQFPSERAVFLQQLDAASANSDWHQSIPRHAQVDGPATAGKCGVCEQCCLFGHLQCLGTDPDSAKSASMMSCAARCCTIIKHRLQSQGTVSH